MPDPVVFNPHLQTLLGQLQGAPPAPKVQLPATDPNPSAAKSAFEAPVDFLLGGLGIKDGLGPDASPAAGVGMGAAALLGGPGFYSRLTRAMEGLPSMVSVGKAAAIAKNLASPEEAAARGLPEFLAQQGDPSTKIPKQAIFNHLTGHPLNVETKTLSLNPEYDALRARQWDPPVGPPLDPAEYQRMVDLGNAHEAPQWGQYTLPGGQNYSETLFHLPDHPAQFQSHAHDTPNIVAWSRQNERLTDTGVPVKHIEEIQSDWGQQGKEFGYEGKIDPGTYAAAQQEYDTSHAQALAGQQRVRAAGHAIQGATQDPILLREYADAINARDAANLHHQEVAQRFSVLAKGVPDQPFKGDSWAELPIKQAIWDVANSDHLHGITLTKPETQIARWPDDSNVKGMQQYYGQTHPNQIRKILAPFGGTVEDAAVRAPRLQGYWSADGITAIGPGRKESSAVSWAPRAVEPAEAAGRVLGPKPGQNLPQRHIGGEHVASTYPPRAYSDNDYGGVMKAREDASALVKHMETINGRSLPAHTEPAWFASIPDEMKQKIKEKGFSLLGLAGLLGADQAQGQPQPSKQ